MPIIVVLWIAVLVATLFDAVVVQNRQDVYVPEFFWVFVLMQLPFLGSMLVFHIRGDAQRRHEREQVAHAIARRDPS